MDENIEVTANVEEVVTPQIDNETTDSIETEVTNEPTETIEEKPQEITQTQSFAKRLKEEKIKAQDEIIAQMYGESHGIYTKADYDRAIKQAQLEAEAKEKGVDPELYSKLNTMESELGFLKREKTLMKQDAELSNDPKIGELYKEWRSDVHEIADKYNVDYDTAMTILTRERLSDIISKKTLQAEQNTIKGLQQNATTTPGALSVGGIDPKQDISKMTSKDFEELTQKAIRGELSKL